MRNESTSSARVTWEVGLWVLIGLVALVMRLAQLDAAPLAADEARGATAAWRAATGQGLPLVDYNPLLLAWNSLTFTLFGASDALARLLPALFGTLLALSPLLLSRSLGRLAMLGAGAYLALSPTALVASRRLEGTTIAALGAMVFVGGVVRFFETRRPGWLTLAAVSLALAVSGGASAYGVLVPLGLAALLLSQLWPEDQQSGLMPDLSELRSHGGRFLLVFSAAVVGFSTGLGWNLAGIGAVGDLLAEWFGRFRSAGSPVASPGLLLIVYELLGTVFGLGALVWGVLERRQGAVLLGLWAGLSTLLLALMPGRMPTDVLWAVLPLALLTGLGVEAVVGRRWSSSAVLRLVYGGIVLVLWAYGYLMVARYTTAFARPGDLALALIAVVLQVLLGVSFGLVLGAGETLRTAAAGTGLTLLAFTLAAGWGVAYRRPADPREALLSRPTSVSVRDLVQTLEDISWRETGARLALGFTFEAPQDSVLAWYLRDFDMARRVDQLGDLTADEIGSVAVTLGQDEVIAAAGGREYAGQDFALQREWTPRELECRFWESGCKRAFEWFLFRDAIPLPGADRWATLWRGSEFSRSD